MATMLENLDWGNWIYGLFAGGIGGGASAVSGAFAASAIDSTHFGFGSTASWKLMGLMFLMNFMKDGFLYLKQNPLPTVKTVTKVETVERQQHPPAVVTTTVEETKVTKAGPE